VQGPASSVAQVRCARHMIPQFFENHQNIACHQYTWQLQLVVELCGPENRTQASHLARNTSLLVPPQDSADCTRMLPMALLARTHPRA